MTPTQPPPSGEAVGRVEQRGIDRIPDDERHGRPRELFLVWTSSNLTYLYIVLGGTMILLGLNVWQAFAVVVAGNLLWVVVGIQAMSGPRSGTPCSVVSRAMFGVRGNRVNAAVLGWTIAVGYEAINLTIGALAGIALAGEVGIPDDGFIELLIVLLVTAVTLTISVYGHATIVKLSGVFSVALAISLATLAVFVVKTADWGYQPPPDFAPHGAATWAAIAAGFTIIASGPLSWGTGADYARYLPANTPAWSVAGWTAFGGMVPAVFLGGIGILAGTRVDMTDPQTSLQTILPGWLYPIFLLIIVVSSITNNVLTAYSSGLFLQAVGVPWSRAITVFFDGVVAVAIACYALFLSSFLDTLNNVLTLSVALLAPAAAIYVTDVFMRRNEYDGFALHDESPESPFWYYRGFNLAGVVAAVLGSASALLCINSPVYVGPVAKLLEGADLSAPVGIVVASTCYFAISSRQARSNRRLDSGRGDAGLTNVRP